MISQKWYGIKIEICQSGESGLSVLSAKPEIKDRPAQPRMVKKLVGIKISTCLNIKRTDYSAYVHYLK